MKKKFFIGLVLIGMCTSITQARTPKVGKEERQEQKNKLVGGAVLEMNLSNFIHSGIDNGSSRMKPGVSVGGFLNLGIFKSFAIQGEMLFHYKTSDFKWNTQTGVYQYWGVEIPVYAMYHYTFSKGNRIYIGIGPYTDFGLGACFKEGGRKIDVYEKEENAGLPAMKDSNTGFGMKAGYEFVLGLQINVTYKVSVTNVIDANSSTVKMYPRTVSVGLAYRFGK